MAQIRKAVLESDMLVFATPLYFFGISAQLKAVIDRFCAFSSRINMRNMKSAFLSVAWNDDDWTMDAIREHDQTLVHYLKGYGHGAGDRLRHPGHDPAQPLSPGGL